MLLAILPILLATMSFAGFVGNATIHAPAVILETNNGTLTIIKLAVYFYFRFYFLGFLL